jgi:lipoate-protein ligase B
MPGSCLLISLGRTDYGRALELQKQLWQLRLDAAIPDTLVLIEHPPVITLGKSARPENLLIPEAELARRGVELHRVERGGDITYHGPGQLVGYPIFHLKEGLVGVKAFVNRVEQGLVEGLARLGVGAAARPGYVGVWCDARKIASVGIAVRRWVTFHGFALNVKTDLSFFTLMNPCGLAQVEMTSVEREGGTTDDGIARAAIVGGFGEVFGVRFQRNLPRSLTSLTNGLSFSAIASASSLE